MAWTWWKIAGGESGSKILETWNSTAVSSSVSGVRKKTGAYSILLPLDSNGANAVFSLHVSPADGRIWVLQAQIWTGTPSSELGLYSAYLHAGDDRYLRLGTDRKLRLYDDGGNLINGPSTTAFTENDWTEFTFIIDALTLGSDHVWTWLYIDGTEDAAWAKDLGTWAGLAWNTTGAALGEDLPGGVSRGTKVYADDITCRTSTTAGDAPHLAAYPRMAILDQPTVADDTRDWAAKGGGAGTWTEWDELGDDDGDTSYNEDNATSQEQLSDMDAAGDVGLPDPCTVEAVCHWAVLKSVADGGTKWAVDRVVQLGVNEETIAQSDPGAVYKAYQWNVLDKPGGGAWVRADITNDGDLVMGYRTGDADHDIFCRVTQFMGMWVYSEADLPLGTTPTLLGRLFGSILSSELVPNDFGADERRFGAVPSDETVAADFGADERRFGVVPTDEQVPNDLT